MADGCVSQWGNLQVLRILNMQHSGSYRNYNLYYTEG